MFCELCGKEIKDESIYCRYCGLKVNLSRADKLENNLENFGINIGNSFISLGDMGSREDRGVYYFDIGVEKAEEKEYREAIEYFEKALFYNPAITNCYGNIALLHQYLGDFLTAMSWYKKGLKETPDEPGIMSNFISLYYEYDLYEEALALNEKLISLYPNENEHIERKIIIEREKIKRQKS